MIKNQIAGAVFFLLVCILVFSLKTFQHSFANTFAKAGPDYSKKEDAVSIIIELKGAGDKDGVYFLPGIWNVEKFLQMVKLTSENLNNCSSDRLMRNGDVVMFTFPEKEIVITSIDNYKKLALGLPMDINNATMDDLMLIPGIGQKTAVAITNLKKEIGTFSTIEQLALTGMGNKKIGKLKSYLIVSDT
ncbi:MAG: helix-hairpin-helix domain-containing protein [Syntrophales bacterium]|nr:helix-hairpin-helix domain-containing protein [Syntrophales bacterium]MDY0044833.1 helix-hairpin-helix domain-containing protein [Syntrophales bacterium]